MGRVVPLSLLLVVGLCGPAIAQERRGPVHLRAGGGPALTAAWYDEYVEVPGFEPAERVRSTEFGAVGSLLVGLAVSPKLDLTAELSIRSEFRTSVGALAGAQIGLGASGRSFLRPALGVAFATRPGSCPFCEATTYPALGLAVGREISVGGRVGLVFEAAALYWAGSDEQAVALSLAIGIVPFGARRRE